MANDKVRIKKTVNIQNRRASYEYHFLAKYTAGIMLTGTEIKSVREGNVNLSDGFCSFQNGELWLSQVHIAKFTEGTWLSHNSPFWNEQKPSDRFTLPSRTDFISVPVNIMPAVYFAKKWYS